MKDDCSQSAELAWAECLRSVPEITSLARPVHGTYVQRETFMLPDRWALHFYEYHGRLEIDELTYELHPGSVTVVPPGAVVTFHYRGPSQHLYCHFRAESAATVRPQAVFLPGGNAHLARLRQSLAEAAQFRALEPLRANVRLWDVLLGIAALQRSGQVGSDTDSVIAKAVQIVQNSMATALSVAGLARSCGLSHNQFIRIVRQHSGLPPSRWLIKLRMERAGELLAYSDLPVKAVACEVGIPDLQHFNKTVRRYFNCSPRQLRGGHWSMMPADS